MGSRITLQRDEMSQGAAKFKKCASDLLSTIEKVPGKFGPAMDAGFFHGWVDSCTTQGGSIVNSIDSITNSINDGAEKQFEIDHNGANKLNGLKICTDFYATNDSEQNEYNKVMLDKMDDKSVNEGQLTNSVDVHGDETTVTREGLTDITGAAGTEHDRQHTNVVQEAIGDINIATNKGVTVDADSNVVGEAIRNIKKDENGKVHETGNSNVANANLVNVNNALNMTASGNIGVQTNKEGLGSASSGTVSGGSGSSASASSNNNTQNAEVPLSTAAFSSKGNSGDKNEQSDNMKLAAGLVGAAGLAGLIGAAREDKKDKEKEENNEDKKDNVQATEEKKEVVEERAKDDKDHLEA